MSEHSHDSHSSCGGCCGSCAHDHEEKEENKLSKILLGVSAALVAVELFLKALPVAATIIGIAAVPLIRWFSRFMTILKSADLPRSS